MHSPSIGWWMIGLGMMRRALPGTRSSAGPRRKGDDVADASCSEAMGPNDPRNHSGDGLGPVFNAKSCAECHHQAGSAARA